MRLYQDGVHRVRRPRALPLAREFFNSAIASSKRLTYEQVDEFLADREAWRRKLGAKVHDLLGRMHELAMILRQRRCRARGPGADRCAR